MSRTLKYIPILVTFLFFCCISTNKSGNNESKNNSVTDLNLENALRMAVIDIKKRIPQNYVVAIINFDTISINFSNYLIDELTSILIRETQLRIVERRRLEIIQEELNFQMSGAVSDDTAKSIGKFIGADTIITGTFLIIGNKYRLGIKSIHVETGLVQSLYITNVSIDRELSLIVRSTNSNISENQISRQTGNNVISSQNSRMSRWGYKAIISPDGRWVINTTLSPAGTINIYDITNGNLLRSFPVRALRFSEDSLSMSIDGRIIAVSFRGDDSNNRGYRNGHVILFDVLTGRQINDIKIDGHHYLHFECLSFFHPIYKNQLIAAYGNMVHIINLETGNRNSVRISGRDIKIIAYSFDGSHIAVGDWDGTITVLDGYSLRTIKIFRGHSGAINTLAFHPNNSILISGSSDFTIGVWDLLNGKELFTLTEHFGEINTVLFTPIGNILLSSSRDGTVKLWDTNNYSVIKNYNFPSERNSSTFNISLSIDGNYFITNDGKLYKIE